MAKLELVIDEWTIPKDYVAKARALWELFPEMNAKITEKSFEQNRLAGGALEAFKHAFYGELKRMLKIMEFPIEYGSFDVTKDGKKLRGYKYVLK